MALEEHFLRQRIVSAGQHPLKHSSRSIAHIHPSLPGVTTLGAAIDTILAVLYPQTKDDVATTGDLPAVGNTLWDYRVVRDDGDGKAAGYRWEQREGEVAASWHKIYDFDWGVDSVLTGFYQKTLDHYVAKYGYNDTDEEGVELTGDLAGQHIYGGRTANTHLTLFANSGDGVGANTGFVQFGDNVRPLSDLIFDLGAADKQWGTVYAEFFTAGTLTVQAGQISDSDGTIDFSTNDLYTDGSIHASVFFSGDGGTPSSPTYTFESDSNSGFYLADVHEIGVSLDSTLVARFWGQGLDLPAGSAPAPALTFGTPTSGIFGNGDELVFAVDSAERLFIDAAGCFWFGPDFVKIDADQERIGFGTNAPEVDFHLKTEDGYLVQRFESEHSTPANASTLQFFRSRAAAGNLVAEDDLFYLDAYGKEGGAQEWLAGLQVRYRGSTRADWIWSTANGGDPSEKMRLRYDGNLGIGVTNPLHTLHVVGRAQVDDLRLDGTTLSVQQTNGDLNLEANGTGVIYGMASIVPGDSGNLDLGHATLGYWGSLYLEDGISDGTEVIDMATLLSFRDALVGAGSGMSLFYDGSLWQASTPDTEVDHGAISGLGDDDHSQYALLAGRSGSQTLKGGTTSGGDLYLESTSHATKGNIFFIGDLAPTANNTYDVGASGAGFKDLYMVGQAIGLRVENYSTGAAPGASAGTKGRLYFDTTTEDLMIDRGGTWFKASVEKSVTDDAVNWDGVQTTWTYTVSADVSDARLCNWTFSDNSNAFAQLVGVVITKTQTQVTVTAEIPLPAGTYRLVGVG